MSAINQNMQENIIKSSLVQVIQDRDVDIARSSQQAHEAFQQELSRRSREVVHEVEEADQNGVDEDPEKERQGKGRKGKRRMPQEPEDELLKGWTMGPDDDGKPHTINIIA